MNDDSTTNSIIRPFPTAPDIRRYYPASVVEEARTRLTRTISRCEGPAHLIGAAGTGKSLLLEVLAAQFRSQMSVVSLIGAQLCTRRALLQMVLFELQLPYRGIDEGELRLSLIEFLRGQDGNLQPMLLLVDEADALPTRLLQELRVLTNVSNQGQPLVSLVLAGSSILEERFAEPELEIFNQRIAARCYLSPLGREETFGYIRSQVAASGGDVDQLFNSDGLEAIYAATDGIPRLINQLGDQLIWMSLETGYQPLDAAIVQQAWSELQQLPAPWNHSAIPATAQADNLKAESGVIEFGDLSDLSTLEPGDSQNPNRAEPPDQNQAEDEEMPASIPFDSQLSHSAKDHVQQDEKEYPVQEPGMESIDATEKLLQNLDEILIEPVDSIVDPVESTPPEAANPFEESFATEEVVIDQYAPFETQLLSTAASVVNQQDHQFANELQRCELNSNTVIVNLPVAQTQAPYSPRNNIPPGEQKKCLDLHGEIRGVVPLQLHKSQPSSENDVRDFVCDTDNNQAHSTLAPITHSNSISPHGIGPQGTNPQSAFHQTAGERSPLLVQGHQFRNLFSQLESGIQVGDV